MKKILGLMVLGVVFLTQGANAADLYVPGSYTTIQSAINAATNGDTVLVNNGTYIENINFLGKGITVQSVHGTTTTIINGNASGSVVTFNSGEGTNSVLSGFTIQNGRATYGGGIYCSNSSSPTISNCSISGNSASGDGGGIYCNSSSSPTITNCTISGNSASRDGGGIYCNSSSPTITNCSISGNSASGGYGGGIFCDSSSPAITNCSISGNSAGGVGGGIFCVSSSSPAITNCSISGNSAEDGGGIFCWSSSPAITNCSISGNSAGWGGGIFCEFSSSPTIANCSISGNSASGQGGGIFCSSSSPTVVNSILWGDTPDEIYLDSSSINITYSDIQSGYAGEGNIAADPQFVGGGDYHLQASSPCIDVGSNTAVPAWLTTDKDGHPRIVRTVDMGAYEFQGTPTSTYIIVIPSQGTVGSLVTVSGAGFGASECVMIHFGNTPSITTASTDGSGQFNITFTVNIQPYGTKTVRAVGLGSGRSADAVFCIQPKIIQVIPAFGTVGTMVTVWGNGFGGNEVVRIDFGTTLMITSIPATVEGTFATTFTIDTQPYGTTTIRATGVNSGAMANTTFRILPSIIFVSPRTGTVGSFVMVRGNGFGATEGIHISFGTTRTIQMTMADASGSFVTTFTVNIQAYGSTTIAATGLNSGWRVTSVFFIFPKIFLTPNIGTIGSLVTIAGNGYGGNESVRIDFGTTRTIQLISTYAEGNFMTTFTINTQPYGWTTIVATGLNSQCRAMASFRIYSSIILVSPVQGIVGTVVTVRGNGFGANELVRVDFGHTLAICSVTSNASGTFTTAFTVNMQPYGTTSIGCYGLTTGLQSMNFFFIRGSIVLISPIAGTVGSSVTVIGNGFGATEMIMISFGSVVSLTTASTTGNGNFNTSFIVDTQPFGNTTISVMGLSTQERVFERFTILPNIIFVTPTSGTIGSMVTVIGNGFGASSCIRIAFGTTRTIAYTSTNLMGVFQCVFTVNTQPQGTTTIIAFDDRLAICAMTSFNIFSRTMLRIIPASQNVAIGQEFTVNIEVINVNRLITAGTYLSFNPAILEVVEMGTGTFIPNPLVMIKKFENGTGTIDYAVGIATNSVTGSGTLCTVKFRAKASGSSTVVFDSDTQHNRNTILIDVDVHEIPCRKESGNYQVIGSLYLEPRNAAVRAGVPTVYNCYAVCGEATITVTGSTTFTSSGGGSFTQNIYFPCFIGTYTITATYLGAIATTSVIITPGTPTQLVKVSGDNQIGTCTTTLPNPFVVKAIDTYSNPCPDVPVGWMIISVPSGASGDSIFPSQTVTTSAGRAEGWLTLGTEPPGTYTVNATSTGLAGSPVIFTAHSLRRFGNIAGFCLLDQGTSTLLGTQGVTVTITELGTSTTTNPQGYFILNNINVGTYTLYFDTYGASPLTVTGTCINPTQINDTTDIGTKTLLAGDITNDGLVNSLDWPYFVNAFGKYEAQGNPDWWTIYREADFDHDTYVNVEDFPVYYYNYGGTQAGRMRSPAMAAMKEKRMTGEKITLSFEIEGVDDVDINDLRVGDIINLKVFINDAKNYFGGEMHLGFNPEILQVITVSQGKFCQEDKKVVISNVDNTQGLIDYTLLLWSPNTGQDSGLFATIPFKVIKGGGYSKIEFDYNEDDNRKTVFVEQRINEEQENEIIIPDVVDDEVTITVPTLYENLESVIVYPNPAHKGDTVHFTKIPNNRTVNLKIFNIAAELVYEGEVKNQNEIIWDLKNKDKNEVASGIYIFLLNDKASPVKKGKIGVIK
ncbi:MAG: right-handed parallel beta-helix repeat-containing protein [bacterium]